MEENNKQARHEHDMHWKAIVSNLFEDFVAFFLPKLYPHIDFSVKEVSMEQEFFKLFPTSEKENTYKDKLFKVKLKDGQEHFVLIHLEIQSYPDQGLPARMFKYFYRVMDKYNLMVTALAVYTDPSVPENHDSYVYDYFGTRNTYEFNAYLVIDQEEDQLLDSENPFALVVLAAKLLNKSKKNKQTRYRYKYKLMKLALKRGYSPEAVRALLTFIHFLLILPKELNNQLMSEVAKDIFKTSDMEQTPMPETFGIFADAFLKHKYGQSAQGFQNKIAEAKHMVQEAMQKAEQAEVEKLKMAKELLKTGMSPKKIAALANLSIEKVNALKVGL